MKKCIAVVLFMVLFTLTSMGQELRSSYFMESSMFRHQMNPAFLRKPYVAVPFMGNINIGSSGQNGLSSFIYTAQNGSEVTFMNPEISSQDFLQKIKNEVNFNINANLNVISVAFNAFNGTNLVELNLRSNTYATFPHHLFAFMKAPNPKKMYSFDKMGIISESYAELALGHSHKINKRLTVGGKIKVLVGGSYAHFKVNHLTASHSGRYWTITGNTEAVAAVFESQFKHSSAARGNKVVGLTRPSLALPGLGAALDMGLDYKAPFLDGLTLSAAVTDLGYMVWKNANRASSNGQWAFEGFKDVTNYDSDPEKKVFKQITYLKNDLVKMLAFENQGRQDVMRTLASTVYLGANYVVPSYDKLHFGVLFSHKFNGLHSFSQMTFSANLRPTHWFEASLNTSTTSEGLHFGAMASFSLQRFHIYVGSDRFFSKLSPDFIPVTSFNANLNFGMVIPLERRYRK